MNVGVGGSRRGQERERTMNLVSWPRVRLSLGRNVPSE